MVTIRSETDSLGVTFAALADPTRRAILARLRPGGLSVNQIAEPFGISLPAVSRHLRVLERAGLITRGRDAQSRPCYLNPAQLKVAVNWLDDYRQYWEQSFDRLDEHLGRRQAGRDGTSTKGTAASDE